MRGTGCSNVGTSGSVGGRARQRPFLPGPGTHYREGISIIELTDMFPTEQSATEWFESLIWPNARHCPRCGCTETSIAAKTSGLPYYCRGCQQAFSVRIGTALERSKVPLRKWVIAIHLEMTSLKGVSSMKLHRDIKVTQKTAWFMLLGPLTPRNLLLYFGIVSTPW